LRIILAKKDYPAMYELVEAAKGTYYIASPCNTGLITAPGGDEAWLIDSGSGDDHARKIYGILQKLNLSLKGILNTHSNADHIGGNSLLQARTGCRVFAARGEVVFIENPELEGALLWGAAPCSELRNSFLFARPSKVTDVFEAPCKIMDAGVEAVPLPGHFVDMAGFMAPGGIFFAADSVFSTDVLDKYHFVFIYDLRKHLETLRLLEKMPAELFVPSHAEPCRKIGDLVRANRQKINGICDLILKLCAAEPAGFEELMSALFKHYGLNIKTSYIRTWPKTVWHTCRFT